MAAPTAVRFLEGELRTYRRQWRASVITTFVNPILFLAAMGLGVGSLVDRGTGAGALEGFAYVTYLAPGLLAATTMQIGTGDAAWPVMAGIRWVRSYEAAMATPIDVRSIVTGHLGYVAFRLLFTAVVFALVMVVLASVTVGGALASVAPGVLTGMAFAAPVIAFTSLLDGPEGLSSLFRFAIVPLYLFSGTFFPVSQLPGWLEPVAYVTPLWHGVELTRAAALGTATTVPAVVNIAYLVVWVGVGTVLARWGLARRMVA